MDEWGVWSLGPGGQWDQGWECQAGRLEQDAELSPKCVGDGEGAWIGILGTCGFTVLGWKMRN